MKGNAELTPPRSDQPFRSQADVTFTADDHVIVNGNPEVAACLDDPLGYLNVGAAWLRIAAGVVVHHSCGACKLLKS